MGKGLALIGIGLPTALAAIGAGIALGPVGSASLAVIAEKTGNVRPHADLHGPGGRDRDLRPGHVDPAARQDLSRCAPRPTPRSEAPGWWCWQRRIGGGFSLIGAEVHADAEPATVEAVLEQLVKSGDEALVLLETHLAHSGATG